MENMADVYDLLNRVNDPDGHEDREKMFQYLYRGRVVGEGLTEPQARSDFETYMNDTCTSEHFARTYFPVWNKGASQSQAQAQQRAEYLPNALAKAATAVVGGLGALVIASIVMDDSKAQDIVQITSGAIALAGVAGGLVAIVKSSLR